MYHKLTILSRISKRKNRRSQANSGYSYLDFNQIFLLILFSLGFFRFSKVANLPELLFPRIANHIRIRKSFAIVYRLLDMPNQL